MKILIISEYIAPLQSIASVRWTKIAKYIRAAHPEAEITVLTDQKEFGPGGQKKDVLLERDMAAFHRYWQVPKGRRMKLYEALKHQNAGQVQSAEQTAYSQSPVQPALLKRELLLAVRDEKERISYSQTMAFLKDKTLDFDVIVSTYGPAWPHLVAERIKKRCPRAVWIADFRDPYAKHTDAPLAFRRHDRFVRRHCAAADVLTKVLDSLYINEPAGARVEVVTNGYDPAERRPSLPPRRFDLVFTGTLYGEKTDLGVFFRLLRELKEEGVLDEEHARLVYAGGQGREALAMAKKQGAEAFLEDKGVLARQQAFALQQSAAVLLQTGWNEARAQCMWTGKTYEYMMTDKPIAYVVTGDMPHSLPAQNIHRLGGVCYEQCRHEETYPALKGYILEKYQEWKRTGEVTIRRDEAYVAGYSYQRIAEQVWRLMEEKRAQGRS